LNIADHISEILETIFGLKYLNSLMQTRDPGIFFGHGSGMENIRVWDKHPGSRNAAMINPNHSDLVVVLFAGT
jgi:hypothetical protein